MTPEQFSRIKSVLLQARSKAPSERATFLREVCGDDPELHREVSSLLAQESSQPSLLEPGRVVVDSGHAPWGGAGGLQPGEEIGPYRIEARIGSGGMGLVYRARQLRPIERDVALKSIKRGMDTERVIARFEAERQTLASLDHPHIAGVLDAGADDTGRPYFVMELVKGEAVTRFADDQCLSVPQRLELVRQVCGALQYAHQRGVIHRDLKPSNLLAFDSDDGPRVKVIDFGIAKAVRTSGAPELTAVDQLLGTPRYMSPEQAALGQVDTRTDVYALGVVLYELLAGRLPIEVPPGPAVDVREVLANTQPGRPGHAITESVALARRTTVPRLSRELSGDLESILAKALRKDPEERYASVGQLADDLARYRAGLPVHARRPTFLYRAGRFVRRHTLAVVSAAALGIVLMGFVLALVVQTGRLATERDRALIAEEQATAKAETARRTTDFLVGVFEASEPSRARGETVTARELLDRGAERLRTDLSSEPEVRAALMDAIGRVYQGVGLWSEAEPLLREGLSARESHLGSDHLDTAESKANLGFLLYELDRYEESEALIREGLAIRSRQLPPTDERVTSSRFALANLQQQIGDLDGAAASFRDLLEIERVTLGPEHPYVAMTINNLATVHLAKGELDEAEPLLRESLAINLVAEGENHPETATNYANLANLLLQRGEPGEALEHSTKALAIRRTVFGQEHPFVAMNLDSMAVHLRELGRVEEAEATFREALAMRRRLLGDRHTGVAHNLLGLGRLLSKEGRSDEAVALLEEAVSIHREQLAEDHTVAARSLYELGMAHLRSGAPKAAEPYLLRAMEIRDAGFPEDHRERLMSLDGVGQFYAALGRIEEAQALLQEVLAISAERYGADHHRTQTARQRLADLSSP